MVCERPGCGTVFCYDGDNPPKRYCSRACMRLHHVERRFGITLDHGDPVCRKRNKGAYPDQEAAAADVAAKAAAYGVPVWPYQCHDCGDWHLTSHPERADRDQLAAMVTELARKLNTRP